MIKHYGITVQYRQKDIQNLNNKIYEKSYLYQKRIKTLLVFLFTRKILTFLVNKKLGFNFSPLSSKLKLGRIKGEDYSLF